MLVGSAMGVAGLTSTAAATETTNEFDDVEGNVTTCEAAGLAGDDISDLVEFALSGDENETLNITSVPEGWDVTGVVVKGGPNYRVYDEIEPDMQSPNNPGDNVPAISHWFICATSDSTTTTPPEEPEPEEPKPEPEDEPSEETTPPAGGGEPAEEPEGALPDTGSSNGALLAAGGLLALGGVALAGRAALASRK